MSEFVYVIIKGTVKEVIEQYSNNENDLEKQSMEINKYLKDGG